MSIRPASPATAGEYAATAKLVHDGRVRVQASGHRIGLWNLHAIADSVPVIAFTAPPSVHRAPGDEIRLQGQRRLRRHVGAKW